ncbi:MAG: 50S ribosomal protein L15 [Clostridia bacterium]|nr:50S ribosomal protein L15 [Clostridia bacterium]MBR0157620.1 50S ribosomal protein L15 [Clostridia bacterium]MBR7062409.1 50S ribosomal protein L15 [Clostridia bacterium]
MKIYDLQPGLGANRQAFRKGRGHGSGNGKTGGRGHKGQKARSGGGVRPGFEGGQTPLYRRMPKRGFGRKRWALVYAEINLHIIDEHFNDGDVVNLDTLTEKGLVRKEFDGLSILGNGELTKKVTIQATRFTKTAAEKIAQAGGKAEVI